MRIGIDCRLWNESGVGRYTRNLIKYLGEIDSENKYTLFAKTSDIENIKYQISKTKNKWKIVTADIRWHTTREQLLLPLILKKAKLDLVHFPYFSLPIFYPGKFVVTIHDLIPLHFDTGLATTLPKPLYKLKRLGYKFIIKTAVKRATKIITVSNATKEEIIKHLGVDESKVVVIHEGIDEQIRNSKFEIRNNYKNTKYKILNTKYFLYVGNAYPHKNLERLIKALNILVSQYPNISLVLVGREDYFYRRLKEKVRRMKCKDNVIFYGEADDDELRSLYKNAKALVVPSLMEGFGLPALEAMANGCLVLASDIPAIREVCSQAAIYFNPYDVDDMRTKMGLVCFNDLNLPAGKAGHFSNKINNGKTRARMFSWQNLARKTLKVYQGI